MNRTFHLKPACVLGGAPKKPHICGSVAELKPQCHIHVRPIQPATKHTHTHTHTHCHSYFVGRQQCRHSGGSNTPWPPERRIATQDGHRCLICGSCSAGGNEAAIKFGTWVPAGGGAGWAARRLFTALECNTLLIVGSSACALLLSSVHSGRWHPAPCCRWGGIISTSFYWLLNDPLRVFSDDISLIMI